MFRQTQQILCRRKGGKRDRTDCQPFRARERRWMRSPLNNRRGNASSSNSYPIFPPDGASHSLVLSFLHATCGRRDGRHNVISIQTQSERIATKCIRNGDGSFHCRSGKSIERRGVICFGEDETKGHAQNERKKRKKDAYYVAIAEGTERASDAMREREASPSLLRRQRLCLN